MELIVFWFGLAIVVGVIAGSRGRNGFGWFLLAVVISPLLAGILAIALPSPQTQREQLHKWNSRKCPFCAELVRNEAIVCKHCGRDLPELPPPIIVKAAAASRSHPLGVAIIVFIILATVASVFVRSWLETDSRSSTTSAAQSTSTNAEAEARPSTAPAQAPAPKSAVKTTTKDKAKAPGPPLVLSPAVR
jgi:hypothetical protein